MGRMLSRGLGPSARVSTRLKEIVNRVPLPFSLSIANCPPNAATALTTADSPTPRPLVDVTALAVENPED
jgi:hypothetical protein